MKDLHKYLSDGIFSIVGNAKSAAKFNIKELLYLIKFKRYSEKARLKREEYNSRGIHIPPFLISSITSSCNLFCKGCYARANKTCGDIKTDKMSVERYDSIFSEAEEIGINFILLAGGEPLMREDVLSNAAKHKKIMFPIFTNGTLMDKNYIDLFNRNRNLLPVISLEGDKESTDGRRGEGVFEKINAAMKELNRKKIFYGCSVTVDKNNLSEVTGGEYVDFLYEKGCKVIFYIEYVPMCGSDGNAIDDSEREILEKGIEKLLKRYKDMIILSFPGDEKYLEGCLAAGRGFFHISVSGDAEPCPFSPYSDVNLKNHNLIEALSSPLFKKLNESGLLKEEHVGGCLLHEKEEEVKKLLKD